jgi:hypothetical protein
MQNSTILELRYEQRSPRSSSRKVVAFSSRKYFESLQ